MAAKLDGKRRKELSSDYNIYNQIKCPVLVGDANGEVNADNPSFSVRNTVDAVTKNIANYAAAYPVSGVNTDYRHGDVKPNRFYNGPDQALGSNYFIPFGRCDEKTSDYACRGRDRYVYVRDIPTGKIPLIGNISFHGLTGCNIPGITDGRGLVPGILEDISDIQPLSLLEAIGGGGNFASFTCKRREYPVGKNIYDPNMECPRGASPEACASKTWWREKRCTPSIHHMKTATDGQRREFPGAPPLFELFADAGTPGTGTGTGTSASIASLHQNARSAVATVATVFVVLLVVGVLLWRRHR